jgi:hypothetical protein
MGFNMNSSNNGHTNGEKKYVDLYLLPEMLNLQEGEGFVGQLSRPI